MNDLFIKYAYHIDNLREDAGIKINDFCDGVCEPRTYRMYISGQRIMSQKMLNGFCRKLKLTPRDFYSSFNVNDSEEYKSMEKVYNYLSARQYEPARKILIMYDNIKFTNYRAELLYEYLVIRYNQLTESITKAEALSRYSKLINYPKCLEKTIFNNQETISITAISELENDFKENKAITFLNEFLSSPTLKLSSHTHKNVLPSIYAQVAYINGLNENYEEVIKVGKRGIAYILSNSVLRELDKLYYYVFFSMYELKHEETDEYCKKFIAATYTKYGNKDHTKRVMDMLKRDHGEEYVLKILSSLTTELLN